jgi:hypothetical protein
MHCRMTHHADADDEQAEAFKKQQEEQRLAKAAADALLRAEEAGQRLSESSELRRRRAQLSAADSDVPLGPQPSRPPPRTARSLPPSGAVAAAVDRKLRAEQDRAFAAAADADAAAAAALVGVWGRGQGRPCGHDCATAHACDSTRSISGGRPKQRGLLRLADCRQSRRRKSRQR